MNILPILLSALGAFVVYMGIGGVFFTSPRMKSEFMKYRAVYRPQEGIRRVMPFGMLAMYLAMIMLAVIFGKAYGGVMPLYAVQAREYFDQRIMGTVFGAVTMFSSLSMAIGPLAGGIVFDTLGTYS